MGLNLFSHLPKQVLDYFKVPSEISNFLIDYSKEKEKPNEPLKTFVNYDNKFQYCFERIFHEGINQIITIDSYSQTKKTNNQFVIIKLTGENICVGKIIFIEENKTIHYNCGEFLEVEQMKQLTHNRIYKIHFGSPTNTCSWTQIVEKVICYQLNGIYFLVRSKKK